MDDARDAAAVLGLHDQHVAAVALRDDLVLQILRRLFSTQVRFERRSQPRSLLAQTIPQQLQLRTRIVLHLAGRFDLVADLRGFAFERRGGGRRGFENRERAGRVANCGARLVNRIEKRRERQQMQRFERARLDGERADDLRQLRRRHE